MWDIDIPILQKKFEKLSDKDFYNPQFTFLCCSFNSKTPLNIQFYNYLIGQNKKNRDRLDCFRKIVVLIENTIIGFSGISYWNGLFKIDYLFIDSSLDENVFSYVFSILKDEVENRLKV